MHTSTRALTLTLLCACLAALSPAVLASGGHGGLPVPGTTLHAEEARVPFSVPEAFPVPVVDVTLNGGERVRLAVDTAMGGTVLLRTSVVERLGLPVVGRALLGDSSGVAPRHADLVRIDSMRVGQLEVGEMIGIGFEAGEAHIAEVPDDIDGVLGNTIYAELLMTLDYPNRTLTFRAGELPEAAPSIVAFENRGGVMAVDATLAGRPVSLVVDSGSRGTITLPASLADELPLRERPRAVAPVSTVSDTYERRAARLAGPALLAGATLVDPELAFADEHTPRLIGYGVLRHFALTVDQAHGRLRFEPAGTGPIEGVVLER